MFARLKITSRIHLLLLWRHLVFCIVGVDLWSLRSQMHEDRQKQLRNLLDLTLSVARADMLSAGGPSTQGGRKAFLSVLQSTRSGDQKDANDIFAFDYNGMTLSHIDPDKMGRNLIELTDANGVKIIQELVQIAKSPSGTGFTSSMFAKGAGGPVTPKLTLVQNVPELAGFAGVGVYLDDVHADFYKRVFLDGGILAVLFLTLGVMGYLIGRSISPKPFSDLAANIGRLSNGDLSIPLANACRENRAWRHRPGGGHLPRQPGRFSDLQEQTEPGENASAAGSIDSSARCRSSRRQSQLWLPR